MGHGYPTWEFAEWFLKTYRLSVNCQISNLTKEIMNERLIDMGNCCSDVSKEGFGTSNVSALSMARALNDRLNAMTAPFPDYADANLPAIGDPGQFSLLNYDDWFDHADGDFHADPLNYEWERAGVQAFGGPQATGTHKWWKFDVPRLIRAHRNIKITLQRSPSGQDEANWQRMIRAGAIHGCMTPMHCLDDSIATGTMYVGSGSTTTIVHALQAYLPHGRVQIGIGLKGLILENNMCNDVESFFGNMTGAEALEKCGWIGGPCTSPDKTKVAALRGAFNCSSCGG